MEWLGGHAVEWEGNVDGTQDDEDGITVLFNHWDVCLRDPQDWSDLCPTHAGVCHEDNNAEDVEVSPEVVLAVEEGVLEVVDIAHWHRLDLSPLGPEKVQLGDAIPADEHGRRTDVVLEGISETELEQVNGHECSQHDTGQSQVHGREETSRLGHALLVPRTPEANEHVQDSTEKNVLFDDLAGRPNPVQYRRT